MSSTSEMSRAIARRVLPRGLRNILRTPSRAIWWAAAEARHRLGIHDTLRIRDGFSVLSHPAAFRMAYHAQLDDPEQVLEFDDFIAACTPGMLLFDVGAHFGLFSLAAVHYGGPAARAVAIDPSPTATRMTRVQAALNRVGKRLAVECAAVGAGDGWLAMVSTGPGGAGYFVVSEPGRAERDVTRTPMVCIDTLAARHGVPTHVKLDVEGFEADAIRGGASTFTGPRPPRLFVELHHEIVAGRGGDPAEALRLLRAYGYTIQNLHGTPVTDAWLLEQPLVRVVASSMRE